MSKKPITIEVRRRNIFAAARGQEPGDVPLPNVAGMSYVFREGRLEVKPLPEPIRIAATKRQSRRDVQPRR